MKNNNTKNNIMNHKDAREASDERAEIGKIHITDIAMTTSNNYSVIDSLMCILELFTVKRADVSVCDLAEDLQGYLFQWTKEYGNAMDGWKDSVMFGGKYKNAPEVETKPALENHTLQILANKLSHILASDKLTDEAKDAFGSIIFNAGNEVNLAVDDPELVKIAFPKIIKALPFEYGKAIVHALTALLDSNLVSPIESELTQYEIRFNSAMLDLFGEPGENQRFNKLAADISAVLKNPLTPKRVYNALADELNETFADTDSPEWILGNLKKLREDE